VPSARGSVRPDMTPLQSTPIAPLGHRDAAYPGSGNNPETVTTDCGHMRIMDCDRGGGRDHRLNGVAATAPRCRHSTGASIRNRLFRIRHGRGVRESRINARDAAHLLREAEHAIDIGRVQIDDAAHLLYGG
jgi:hypothetical protein